MAQLAGRSPANQKVVSSFPSQGTCLGCRFSPVGAGMEGNQLMSVSCLLALSSVYIYPRFSLSKSNGKISSGEGLKKTFPIEIKALVYSPLPEC